MRSPADPLGARAGALTPIHASPEPAGSPHVRPFVYLTYVTYLVSLAAK